MSLIRIKNYINGQQVDPKSGVWLDNDEPATGQVYCEVPDSNEQDIADAVAAAKAADASE